MSFQIHNIIGKAAFRVWELFAPSLSARYQHFDTRMFFTNEMCKEFEWKKYVKKFTIPAGETFNSTLLDCNPKPVPYHKTEKPDSLDGMIYEDEYEDEYPPPTDEPPANDTPPQEAEPIIDV